MPVNTYQNIYKELLNCISLDDILSEVSWKFKTLKTDTERIAECYSLLTYYNLFPDYLESKCKKSVEEAEKLKNNGNRAFINKDDYLALYYYTKAISYAPITSKQISIAYANRSAVSYSLGDFLDSIKDIDRALSGDYPAHLKYKLLERKGKSLQKVGNFIDAERVFQAAIDCLLLSNLNEEKQKLLASQLKLNIEECLSFTGSKICEAQRGIPELTHGCHPYIQSGSCAVDIEYSPAMGRFLVATENISPGDVLAVEKPFSSITLPNSYFSHCFYCQKRCHSMIPCPRCTLVCFCNEECRDSSMKDSHSIECNILKPLLDLNCGKMELLSLRVLMNATEKGRLLSSLASSLPKLEAFPEPKKKGFTGDFYRSDSYKSIHNLEGNTNLRDVSYLFCRSVVACCMLYILDSETEFFIQCNEEANCYVPSDLQKLEEKCVLSWDKIFAGGLLLKYLQSMASNAHEISEMRIIPLHDKNKVESYEIGSAAYSFLSLINHSCDPNVVRHSHAGSTVVLTAIQAIKKGQQIFDNYGFHHATHSKEERHSHLDSQYHFTCLCIACSENWPLYGSIPSGNYSFISESKISKEIVDSSEKYKEILDKMMQEKYLEIKPEVLDDWLKVLHNHLKLLQENVKRPWQEFSGCQEVIKQCLSFLANHYSYKSSPQALLNITDSDTGVTPF